MVIKYKVDENRPWFSGKFFPEGMPKQLDYDYDLTLPKMLAESAEKYADNPAYWFLDTFMTYKELKLKVDIFATALRKQGVKQGDVVAILMPNSFQYIISYQAIATLGAVSTGINPTYKPLEILHQLKLTGAKYLIVLDMLYAEYVSKIIDQWPLEKIIYTNLVDLASGMPGIKKFLGKVLKKIPGGNVDHPNAVKFMDCMKTKPEPINVKIDPENDAATLIMTGGTTGIPKAAELTHENVISNAQSAKTFLISPKDPNSDIHLGEKTGMVGTLPLFHSYAHTVVMNSVIAAGGWGVLFPVPPPTEELLKTFTKLPNYNYFIYPGVEILFQRIAELPDEILKKYDVKGIFKLCASSAGPLHDYVRDPFEAKTGAKITELYGLSEASPGVSANNFYGLRESGTIGIPLPGTDWDIFPADDFSKGPIGVLGEEGTGEICVCGPQVMKGYWQNPERTAATIKEWDGRKWLLTGDIGYMDEDGRVTIRDRKKQLIKMAGHSVFPAETESLIGNHPKVLEVAVAGVPDKKTGEAVKAWVALKPEAIGTITAEDLLQWSQENMTRWKAPKYLEFVDEVPKNAIGKIMRRTLQEADPLFEQQ